MSVFPVNRVPDILKRMDLNSSQAEAMKTCFGILAIMSREDSNKLLIAKDGMEIILNAMTVHVDRTDVQESGCDLLWSLAFNSSAVKDIIAKFGGATVLVRALKRHSRSSDFLKSACGALSNMCQSKLNQEGVSSQGGLQPLVGAIHVHQNNAKLLPFIFDAIASIIVNNEENARTVSTLGIIPVVVASLSRHKPCMEVVKSGCHTLAILSDVKGQASKIAFAGGVPIILSLLDAHPLYSDLHRVAAVVLLRMLQESSHVGREITCHEGVRILLNSLEKGGAQQDTVAAVTHILYTVTNPASPASSAIESQLWLPNKLISVNGAGYDADGSQGVATGGKRNGVNDSSPQSATALAGVVLILGQYSGRRDVVRAACRLINNLSGFPNVIAALDRLYVLDKILECAAIHKDTKDVIDSTNSLLKAIHKKGAPALQVTVPGTIHGMLHVFRVKSSDEESVVAFSDTITRVIEASERYGVDRKRESDEARMIDGKPWEHHALDTAVTLLKCIADVENSAKDPDQSGHSVSSSTPVVKSGSTAAINFKGWSKHTTRAINGLLSLIETIFHAKKLATDPLLTENTLPVLQAIARFAPLKSLELTQRVEMVIQTLEVKKSKNHDISSEDPFSNTGKRNTFPSKPTPIASVGSPVFDFGDSSAYGGSDLFTKKSSNKGSLSAVGVGVSSTSVSMDDEMRVTVQKPQRSGSFRGGNTTNRRASNADKVEARKSQQERWALEAKAEEKAGSEDSSEKEGNGSTAVIGTATIQVTENGRTRLLPQHPLKQFDNNGSVNNRKGTAPKTLLHNWPQHLERLLIPSNPTMSRPFLSPVGQQDISVPTRMHLVYESSSAAGLGLISKCPTAVPYVVPPQGLGDPFEHSLTFDSEFASGNLLRAVQKADSNYDLFLRSDLHSPGHTQWFYFAVSNTHPPDLVKLAEQGVQVPPVRVRFNIVNLTKPDSLFNMGMRPVVYSVVDANTKNVGWVRAGSDISYYGNTFQRNNTAGEGMAYYYTLSFTLEFQHANDTTLIAYTYPYTYGDYRAHISDVLSRTGASDVIRQSKLCDTLGGEECHLLAITNFREKDKERLGPLTVQALEQTESNAFAANNNGGASVRFMAPKGKDGRRLQLKPCLFFSGRVHPGETPASWMMKGMLDFLTSSCPQAKLLRQVFVIFIVPMLNPDGVIYGNNRCSLAGVDLNRQWKLPVKTIHPTVFHLKNFMAAQRRIREVMMYIDLHGHSRKYNVFMYGCDDKKKPKPQVRAFPKFFSMHHVGRKYVSYTDCSFNVKKGRESTARVVVSREMNIPCSFTLEATFCGSNYGPLKHCHMNIGHLQEVGSALSDAVLNFAISEGHVKDNMTIPNSNLKAIAHVAKAIEAEEDGADFGDIEDEMVKEYYMNDQFCNKSMMMDHVQQLPHKNEAKDDISINSRKSLKNSQPSIQQQQAQLPIRIDSKQGGEGETGAVQKSPKQVVQEALATAAAVLKKASVRTAGAAKGKGKLDAASDDDSDGADDPDDNEEVGSDAESFVTSDVVVKGLPVRRTDAGTSLTKHETIPGSVRGTLPMTALNVVGGGNSVPTSGNFLPGDRNASLESKGVAAAVATSGIAAVRHSAVVVSSAADAEAALSATAPATSRRSFSKTMGADSELAERVVNMRVLTANSALSSLHLGNNAPGNNSTNGDLTASGEVEAGELIEASTTSGKRATASSFGSEAAPTNGRSDLLRIAGEMVVNGFTESSVTVDSPSTTKTKKGTKKKKMVSKGSKTKDRRKSISESAPLTESVDSGKSSNMPASGAEDEDFEIIESSPRSGNAANFDPIKGLGTIVKAEYNPEFLVHETDPSDGDVNLAKTQPVAATYGLPKNSASEKW